MRYYQVRTADSAVTMIIDTEAGDVVAAPSDSYLLAEPVVAGMMNAGGHATEQAALEANGYIWGIK